ncbi:DnaD domain protein [Ruminococcus sp. FC2018]|uniref:DnaD domain-containing protein n=1 Tax=Ruminococcus sp. FC2018 TaxID=1410617 RepID=UPI00048EB268|nr:DnaD domain protein [Ruminococcus sp. FC2018]
MDYKFDIDYWGGQFSVPCSVVTEYLKTSDGDYVKVLLCILAAPVRTVSSEYISQISGVDINVVEDAVIHWTSLGVIKAEGINSSAGSVISPDSTNYIPHNDVLSNGAGKKSDVLNKTDKIITIKYTQKELLEKANTDPDLKKLFDEIQSFLKKTLNGTELARLVEVYELYNFDVPTILITAEYLRLVGKCTVNYLSSVLRDWSEREITSYSDVEREINRLTEFYDYENMVRRCFEMSYKLTKNQKAYAEKWQSMGIGEPLLEIAKEKCLDGTSGKLNFGYIDKIIIEWNKNGVKTPKDVETVDEKFRNSKKKFVGSDKDNSYSVDKVENMIKNFSSEGGDNKK